MNPGDASRLSFVYSKQKNVPPDTQGLPGFGDVWTWVAVDADTKLVPTWLVRMHMRRFTQLTNAFSKKLENHEHAVALHYMNYNFCRIHQSLRTTPAMAAGVTTWLWEIEDIVG